MNFEELRKLIITALFSDNLLFEQLVLKGGNAMSLVYGISARVSLDLDFSLETDFEDVGAVESRMERALVSRFATVGFTVFDVKLLPKPSGPRDDILPWWGGYELQFKLIDDKLHRSYGPDSARIRREAFVLGPRQQRVFTVDLSKHEYCQGKVRADLDDYTIYVYPPAMIALEKLRAICQQMEGYAPTGITKRPRARDFFDIFTIVTKTEFRFDSRESLDLLTHIFAAKRVPLSLLGNVANQRDFHRDDWPSVTATVAEPLEDFNFYFDFLLVQIEPLHSLWIE